ncbi:hypothetical protein ERO13_D11G264700v2 [Gossypium hirsutum]|uniref:Uncharacterized protein n=5 Tax=Gossypium TaxID=3633 RepID=A0A0D2SLE4_GOSRA|nr:hypothetical protein ES319_D11G289200v1 [Gossypium barbadense]KAG4122397.1 hypothetical protein ERO13_D11G264700v2 [Gossypium hirsutum]KJB45009.1 hypothetical protein B456_007G284800 [Gossypium raimondii]TYI57646.1 hypothetical protein E1A91_D11G296100v1 [Gossypium mustelinum]
MVLDIVINNSPLSKQSNILSLDFPPSKCSICFTYHESLHFSKMGWLRSLLFPLKKLWFRMHSAPTKSRGIYILYEDVKSCTDEDVHVLWSILVESHSPQIKPKQ